MLRFYSYYKQATEGPCQQAKPAFWEVVKKAKWDAWSRLGNMSRMEAMNNYVEELTKVNIHLESDLIKINATQRVYEIRASHYRLSKLCLIRIMWQRFSVVWIHFTKVYRLKIWNYLWDQY